MVMLAVSLILVVATQMAAGTAQALAGEACAEPGALRKEPSGNLSACVTRADRQHAWMSLGQFDLSAVSPRMAPSCTGLAGQMVCGTDCTTLGVCYNDDVWNTAVTCAEICRDGECIEDDDLGCPGEYVICRTKGKYPDLTDCSKYYECEDDLGYGNQTDCDEDEFFDACFQNCYVVSSGQCTWAVDDPCGEIGATGVAPYNDRLYYICTEDSSGNKLLIWDKCANGHFNLTSMKCGSETIPGCISEEGNTTTTSTTTTTTTTTPPTTETTEATTPAGFLCTSAGIHPNPGTNCSFYYCYSDFTFILIRCSTGYHYDDANKTCVLGECT